MLDAALREPPEPDAPKHLRCGSHRVPQRWTTGMPLLWHAAQTHPQAEDRALTELVNQGYAAFCPRYSIRLRNPRFPKHVRFVSRPLFTSYVFAGWAPNEDYGPVMHTRGIRRLLTGVLPTDEIRSLQAGEAIRRRPPPTHTIWRPGEAAQLNDGPFRGQEVVVTSVGQKRATVVMLMLGGLREIGVDLDCLSPRDA